MLREPGSGDTAVVSHYHLRHSPAGPGNVAVIHVPGAGADGAHVVATDNEPAAAFAKERFFAGRSDYFHGDLPVRRASFARIGEGRPGEGWRYRFDGTEVAARWFVREPPVVAHGRPRPGDWCFTVLFFAEEAELHSERPPRAGRAVHARHLAPLDRRRPQLLRVRAGRDLHRTGVGRVRHRRDGSAARPPHTRTRT